MIVLTSVAVVLTSDDSATRGATFSEAGAVHNSAVPVTRRACGEGLWCFVWSNHDQISPVCSPRSTQSRLSASQAPQRYKSRFSRDFGRRERPLSHVKRANKHALCAHTGLRPVLGDLHDGACGAVTSPAALLHWLLHGTTHCAVISSMCYNVR